MRKCIATGAFLLAGVSGAMAGGGDYGPPRVDWTGFYVGAHAGYGWGEWDGGLFTTAGCPNACPQDAGYTDPFHTLSGNGWLGGLQLGYNLQRNSPWVFGLEADVSWTDISASDSFATDKHNPSVWDKKHDLKLDAFGTARVRVGYAMGNLMPYLTGGLAWGKTSGDLAVSYYAPAANFPVGPPTGISGASADETHVGWTLGGGVEAMLGGGFSLKVEYLYVDLGEEGYNFTGGYVNNIAGTPNPNVPFDTDSFKSDLTFQTVRVGINYKFGETRGPLK